MSKRYQPHQRRGAKSFVDDLGLSRGVVLSRAAASLRSIETKPFDSEICPLQTDTSPNRHGLSTHSPFVGGAVGRPFLLVRETGCDSAEMWNFENFWVRLQWMRFCVLQEDPGAWLHLPGFSLRRIPIEPKTRHPPESPRPVTSCTAREVRVHLPGVSRVAPESFPSTTCKLNIWPPHSPPSSLV